MNTRQSTQALNVARAAALAGIVEAGRIDLAASCTGLINPKERLSVGDKLLVAAAGDALDGGFRLDAIKPTELVFIHVQQGVTVRMPLSGAPS